MMINNFDSVHFIKQVNFQYLLKNVHNFPLLRIVELFVLNFIILSVRCKHIRKQTTYKEYKYASTNMLVQIRNLTIFSTQRRIT